MAEEGSGSSNCGASEVGLRQITSTPQFRHLQRGVGEPGREGAGFLLICDRNRVLFGVQQTEEEGEHVRYEKAVKGKNSDKSLFTL